MASIDFQSAAGQLNGENNAAFQILKPRVNSHGFATSTGIIGAALAANSSIFAMRLDPGSAVEAWIQRIRVKWTTLTAFTVPVSATGNRRLELYRGVGAAASGGSAVSLTTAKKHPSYSVSECDSSLGGDTRVATTAALTVTGITFDALPIRSFTANHLGASGAYGEILWEFHETENHPLVLTGGQLIAIRNPVIMDAAGTWTASIDVDWFELAV